MHKAGIDVSFVDGQQRELTIENSSANRWPESRRRKKRSSRDCLPAMASRRKGRLLLVSNTHLA